MSKFNSAPDANDAEQKVKATPKWQIGKDEKAIAAIAARNEANKAKRAEARAKLVEFIKAYGDEEIKKAAAVLWSQAINGKIARAPGSSAARVTSAAFLLSLFPEGVTSVSEMDIFTRFQYGRAEMRSHIVRAIKQAKDPAERVWVAFDFGSKTYTLKGLGAEAPEGWTGYKPAVVNGEEVL